MEVIAVGSEMRFECPFFNRASANRQRSGQENRRLVSSGGLTELLIRPNVKCLSLTSMKTEASGRQTALILPAALPSALGHVGSAQVLGLQFGLRIQPILHVGPVRLTALAPLLVRPHGNL